MNAPIEPESAEVSAIAAEVRALRKGRGINTPDLSERLGPHLRRLANMTDAGNATGQREKLIEAMNDCASDLARDLRLAISASLGLTHEFREQTKFTERMVALAGSLGYEYRTALRRVEDAEILIAEAIAVELHRREGRASVAPHGWYLDELRTVLRLDTPMPESHERRRIVATRDGLAEVVAWLHVPSLPGLHQPSLSVDVLYGGRLLIQEQEQNLFRFVIQLPAPLKAKDTHEYGLIVRVLERGLMRPYYVVTPECRCMAFDLRVRFSPDRLPSLVRKVNGEPVRNFESPQWDRENFKLDAAGEAHVHFDKLDMYVGYGLQWEWPS